MGDGVWSASEYLLEVIDVAAQISRIGHYSTMDEVVLNSQPLFGNIPRNVRWDFSAATVSDSWCRGLDVPLLVLFCGQALVLEAAELVLRGALRYMKGFPGISLEEAIAESLGPELQQVEEIDSSMQVALVKAMDQVGGSKVRGGVC